MGYRFAIGECRNCTAFIVRSGLNVTVARDAQWRPLADCTVTAFTDALNRSPLNAALMRVEADVVVPGVLSRHGGSIDGHLASGW